MLSFNANPQNAMTATPPANSVVHAPGAPAREAPPNLPKSVRARVNHFAHQSGAQHATIVREALLGMLNQAVESGISREDLAKSLDAMEAAAGGRLETNQNS